MILCVSVIGSLPAVAQQPLVTITGGADPSGTTYQWTVTNRHSSPIVYIEFPHYRATLFFAPEGWSTSESTNLLAEGHPVKPGSCIARAQSDVVGILSQRSADFRMQISPGEIRRGSGKVTLHFADESKSVVRGVELPQRQSLGDQYVSLIGLGGIFIIFLTVKSLKKKRTPHTNHSQE